LHERKVPTFISHPNLSGSLCTKYAAADGKIGIYDRGCLLLAKLMMCTFGTLKRMFTDIINGQKFIVYYLYSARDSDNIYRLLHCLQIQ